MREGTIEVRETVEEPVVQKVARVTEEIEVGKRVDERTETIRDTVRHTEVEVDENVAAGRRTDGDLSRPGSTR
jgi:stress response protein YsnF